MSWFISKIKFVKNNFWIPKKNYSYLANILRKQSFIKKRWLNFNFDSIFLTHWWTKLKQQIIKCSLCLFFLIMQFYLPCWNLTMEVTSLSDHILRLHWWRRAHPILSLVCLSFFLSVCLFSVCLFRLTFYFVLIGV